MANYTSYLLDPRDPPDPHLTPTEFRQAMVEALEEEATTRRFADAHKRLFESVMPLQGVTKQAARLKKQEKFLRTQIVSIKDDLRLRKQIDEDGALVSKGMRKIFVAVPDSDSDSEIDSDDYDDADDSDEEARGFDLAEGVSYHDADEDGADVLGRTKVSVLRKSFLDAGIPATLLSLDTDAIAPSSLDLPRLVNEIVVTPYHGKLVFMYAIRPSVVSSAGGGTVLYDTGEVTATIELLGDLCQGLTPTLSGFAGATDYQDHVILGISSPRGANLKRICRSLRDGDIRLSKGLQVMLAHDLAKAAASLHAAKIVHGGIATETVIVTLHQPCMATLLFFGSGSSSKSEADDILDLGRVFATVALRKCLSAGALPTAGSLRAAALESEDPPCESLMELVVQMTQEEATMRPTCAEAVDWLQAIVEEEGLADDKSSRVLQPTAHTGSAATIYELQRDASPMRRFLY